MDPFLQKIYDRPINGRFVLVKQLGAGGFGVVYLANDLASDREVALKLEHHSIDPSLLSDEAEVYKLLEGQAGIPEIYWFGYHDDFRVLAFELLGPSLEDLLHYCDGRFTLKTTLMIIDQLLVRLETLHRRGFVHRDIKPRNFLLGTGKRGSNIYLCDFGLVYNYRTDSARDQPVRPRLIGTTTFASIRGHQGHEQSPRDDLESLGYMVVFLLKGKLPWQNLSGENNEQKRRAVMDMKMAITADQMCAGLPREFRQFTESVKSLGYGDLPDYDELRAMFRRLAMREGLEDDHVYDWTIRDYLENESTVNAGL